MSNVSELKQVNVALAAFAMKAAPAARKPMSEEAIRRRQPDAATSNAASITE